jgi:hypothetical protein
MIWIARKDIYISQTNSIQRQAILLALYTNANADVSSSSTAKEKLRSGYIPMPHHMFIHFHERRNTMSHRQHTNKRNEAKQAKHLRLARHRIKKSKPADLIRQLEAQIAADKINLSMLKESNESLREGNTSLQKRSEKLLRCIFEAGRIIYSAERLPGRKIFVTEKTKILREALALDIKNWREQFKEYVQ